MLPQQHFQLVGFDLKLNDFCSQLNFLYFSEGELAEPKQFMSLDVKVLCVGRVTVLQPAQFRVELLVFIDLGDVKLWLWNLVVWDVVYLY